MSMYVPVAPYTGAWIEIYEKGQTARQQVVAPYTGAWIEIQKVAVGVPKGPGRSLHGSVD